MFADYLHICFVVVEIVLTNLNTPMWKAWGSASRAQLPLRTGIVRHRQSPSKKSLPPLAVGWPLTQPNHPFSLGRTCCVLTLVNIIPKFPMKKSHVSVRFIIEIQHILCVYMYSYKKIQDFLRKLCWLKNWRMWGFTPKSTNGGRDILSGEWGTVWRNNGSVTGNGSRFEYDIRILSGEY